MADQCRLTSEDYIVDLKLLSDVRYIQGMLRRRNEVDYQAPQLPRPQEPMRDVLCCGANNNGYCDISGLSQDMRLIGERHLS